MKKSRISFNPGLEIGQVVTTKEINKIFGVDEQQGIRTSKKYNYIVIVSKNIKGKYEDQWVDEYLIHYTGAGLKGDQKMAGRNRTLANANIDQKQLFFFEVEEKGKYIYRGLCDLVGEPFESIQKDENGNLRKVYLFPLKLHVRRKKLLLNKDKKNIYDIEERKFNYTFVNLKTKEIILNRTVEYSLKPEKKCKPTIKNGIKIYPRSKKRTLNALAKSGYQCEYDLSHKSFLRKNIDIKYTEPHHLVPLSFSDQFEFSLDVEENIISLCSECHNNIHYGKERFKLLEKLYNERKDILKLAGIDITFAELKQMYK